MIYTRNEGKRPYLIGDINNTIRGLMVNIYLKVLDNNIEMSRQVELSLYGKIEADRSKAKTFQESHFNQYKRVGQEIRTAIKHNAELKRQLLAGIMSPETLVQTAMDDIHALSTPEEQARRKASIAAESYTWRRPAPIPSNTAEDK